jgi:hypothetical protein
MLRNKDGEPLCDYCGKIPKIDADDCYDMYQGIHAQGIEQANGIIATPWICVDCGGEPHDDDNCEICKEIEGGV